MKNKICFMIELILYVILFIFMKSIIEYTHYKKMYIIFFTSLFFNILITIYFDKSKSNKYLLGSILMNIFLGFIIFFYGNMSAFFMRDYLTNIHSSLFYLLQYFLTGNWLLPIMLYSLKNVLIKTEG